MKVIGFVDDAQFELDAFRMAFESRYKIITSSRASDFIARVATEKEVDLLLFDLYFPIPGETPGKLFNKPERSVLMRKVSDQCNAFKASTHAESDMAIADNIRRAAGRVMQDVLHRYVQGPEGGLKLYGEVREVFPSFRTAFLSRKRTADDVFRCLDAGALEVLQKPVPHDGSAPDPDNLTAWALRGWQDNYDLYVQRFENLMSQDVVLSLLTRLELQLALYDWRKSESIRKEILSAKQLWLTAGDVSLTQQAVRNLLKSYETNLPSAVTWDAVKILILLLPQLPKMLPG